MTNAHQRLQSFKSCPVRLLVLILVSFFTTTLPAQQRGDRCYVIDLTSEIDLGTVSYVERAIQKAEADHAIVLLHLNTFGGRVDAATKIRDAVLNAKVPLTIAFIDKRAISAGAFISLAAKKIVFSSGSTMGAATPVYENGDRASEKVVSYMRGEMRSTAEKNNRNPQIAEAMVDESVTLDSTLGITLHSGKLLTLTTEDAKKVGYADTTAETIATALTAVGYPNVKIEKIEESFGDGLLRFLTNGFVSSLLIMLGLAGLFYSIKTGHFGGITIIGIVALLLFFGGQYMTSVAPIMAIVFFMVGIGLLLFEVTIPGFGIAGVLGLLSLGLGLFLALAGDLRTLTPERLQQIYLTLAVALLGFMVLAALIIKFAPKTSWMKRLYNQETSGDTTSFMEQRRVLIGRSGLAQTMLRPAGTAIIDGAKVDVITNGEFVSPGTPVIVTGVEGTRIIVRTTSEQAHIEDESNKEPNEPFGGRLPNNLEPRV